MSCVAWCCLVSCASLFVCRLVLSGELLCLLFVVCCLCVGVGCCLARLVCVFSLFCRSLSDGRRADYSCARLSGVVVVVHVAQCVLSAEHNGVCCSLCRCKLCVFVCVYVESMGGASTRAKWLTCRVGVCVV